MHKILLVDGNNLLFRSYYATAYNGNFMKNSKGFPTNALFGFVNMINKIVTEEHPEYMIVAFDKGKTFRHEKYEDYKGGRMATPDELKVQFPIAKDILSAMGIKYYEIDHYEADDILGTFAHYCDQEEGFVGTIISSDKDLLQLISNDVDIKLLKQKDSIRYDKNHFIEAYGFAPKHIVDLKALMGDSSDNIVGVKGVGEKTAMKLIQEYETIDNLYDHIDEVKGALKEKLVNGKESAYQAYDLATIVKDVPMDIHIPDTKYLGPDDEKLNMIYEELEFYSFLRKSQEKKKERFDKKDVKIIRNKAELKVDGEVGIYLEILGTNYHTAKILGMAVYNDKTSFYIPLEVLKEDPEFLHENIKYTYDVKKVYVALKKIGISLENVTFDTMLASYLLDYNVKEDVAYLANTFDYDIPFYETLYGKSKLKEPDEEEIAYLALQKAKFIYETKTNFEEKLKKEEVEELFQEIEMPLAIVLGDMELEGFKVDRLALDKMGEELQESIKKYEKEIFDYAGCEFNISSPKQLGEILFEKLNLPHGKKNSNGYSTAAEVLEKLRSYHPIIDVILEYRAVTKLYTTYVVGMYPMILEDGKIHTIYLQTGTRTGRLSSIEPNLQNIPMRNAYGKLIRKAFVPARDYILSGDYSQIELRILAHMANVPALIEAFKEGMDIHTKTAMDIFHVKKEEVSSNMRRIAKAVNFGIIYGISGFGLSENIGISVSDAQKFIQTYLETYPGIAEYMEKTKELARQNGFVTTLFKRKRWIPELNNKNVFIRKQGDRIALNTPIQGTSADIIKKAMVEIHTELRKRNFETKMILQIHDELVFDTKKEELESVMKLVKDIMEHTIALQVPLNVDLEYGETWYSAK